MGRRLVRAREAVRRMFGKPGRRKGVEQRLGLEVPDGLADSATTGSTRK